jgi:multicomponent Na+:H+ antiporter subunit D
MFMAAGLIYAVLGHDRIAELGGVARAIPMTIFAFALGGVSLIGLPPSGGFLAKWLLLEAAVATGQWWWAIVILAGGLFTSAYMFIVLSRAVAPPSEPLKLLAAVPRYQEAAALALALTSLLLGLVALGPIDILQVGRPDSMMVGPR